jgi:hypothetical protein
MLSAPMEILEVNDGEAVAFTVVAWQEDDAIIKPARAPQGVVVHVLRVHVGKEDKPMFPHYWDVTGGGAIAQMLPALRARGNEGVKFTLTARGEGPKKRYSVEVV